MSAELDRLTGRLTLAPGSATPIVCERPMVSATLMRRLTEGRHAALLPDLVASVFSLCAGAQRSTARRALAAALELAQDPARRAADHQLVALSTAREHLQRLALDLPRQLPLAGIDADPQWLRDAPVLALPSSGPLHEAQRAIMAALPGWLERRLFAMTPAEWLQRWRAAPLPWLDEWLTGKAHPVARWLAAVQPQAQALALPCRPLNLLADGEAGLQAIAADLITEPDFAQRPLWHGRPAETGPWTRAARSEEAALAQTAWFRLGARLADLAAIASGEPLECGALALGPGEGIAWTEMSRGLLLHWVQLEAGARHPDSARVAAFRVLAPTEWNFHPQGTLGAALAAGRIDADGARLAALALDPCIGTEIVQAQHA